MTEAIATHPVQIQHRPHVRPAVPVAVSMRAYEVYCHLYGMQTAMVEGNCRGGFGIGEIVAFLYARSFPKNEWRSRVDEAMRGMVLYALTFTYASSLNRRMNMGSKIKPGKFDCYWEWRKANDGKWRKSA